MISIFFILVILTIFVSGLPLSLFVSAPIDFCPLFVYLSACLLDYLCLAEYLLACCLIGLIYLSLIIGPFVYIVDLDIGLFVRMSINIIDKYYSGKMACSLLNALLEAAGPL